MCIKCFLGFFLMFSGKFVIFFLKCFFFLRLVVFMKNDLFFCCFVLLLLGVVLKSVIFWICLGYVLVYFKVINVCLEWFKMIIFLSWRDVFSFLILVKMVLSFRFFVCSFCFGLINFLWLVNIYWYFCLMFEEKRCG